MNRRELLVIVAESKIFQQWHWFRWHFQHPLAGEPNGLADSIIESCLICETKIPGYAERTISMMASLGGREKHLPHWEQLLQVLAELLVVTHIVRLDWDSQTTFESEPSVDKQGRNPELIVCNPEITLAVEVKAPALFAHRETRSRGSDQIASRFAPRHVLENIIRDVNKVTLPRDNPVKDFLVSAQGKFSQFAGRPNFLGVLVIVWDDFIFEPISALSHPAAGLLTENSFHRDENGDPVTYPAISAVVVIRQLHQMLFACRGEPLADGLRSPLQYETLEGFPPKVILGNAISPDDLSKVGGMFSACSPDPTLGTEYTPKELIWWI